MLFIYLTYASLPCVINQGLTFLLSKILYVRIFILIPNSLVTLIIVFGIEFRGP